MKQLIEDLISREYLKTPGIIDAFYKIDRVDFVPEDLKVEAYVNVPLPIGYGQTISQPYIVALMSDLLATKPEHSVLEIGTGWGYQTAILVPLWAKVSSVASIAELSPLSEECFSKVNYKNIDIPAS